MTDHPSSIGATGMTEELAIVARLLEDRLMNPDYATRREAAAVITGLVDAGEKLLTTIDALSSFRALASSYEAKALREAIAKVRGQ